MNQLIKIGAGIRRIRKAKGYTIKSFSEKHKFAHNYISSIERDVQLPTLFYIKRIADALEVPIAALFWFSIEEKDIKPDKRFNFNLLKSSMDKMMIEVGIGLKANNKGFKQKYNSYYFKKNPHLSKM